MELISQKPQCILRKLMEYSANLFLFLSPLPVHFVPLLIFHTHKHCNLNFCNFIDIQLDRCIVCVCVLVSVLHLLTSNLKLWQQQTGYMLFSVLKHILLHCFEV